MTQLADLQQPEARRRMSYQEFLDDPTIEHAEWVDGEMVPMVGVTDEHDRVTTFLLHLLVSWVDLRGLGRVLKEPFNVKLGGGGRPGRSPDIGFLSNDHLPRLREKNVDGALDVAVEVVSPGSRGTDRGDKYAEYEAAGVTEYWLIDPERRVAEFYRLGVGERYELMPVTDGVFRSGVVDGFWLRVSWLWEQPRVRDAERELGID
jgi:Uma2 family endonuclease